MSWSYVPPEVGEKLRNARLTLDGARGENIVALCKHYLALLAEYRSELYRLPDELDLNPQTRQQRTRRTSHPDISNPEQEPWKEMRDDNL